jgi:frataxin-like iron-binding protein CyaY
MNYSKHTYPRELAERIISEWPEVTNSLDGLPPKEALISLLNEAFQASLLREESRPITCRLILINPSELSEAEGPPTGMHVLQLEGERKLSAQEIRRLSPCATFYRSLIGIRWDSEEGFRIWAILNSGTRWVARIDGGRLQSSTAPGRLTIHVSGPGNLIISRGDNLITTLLNGRLEGHGFDIYEARWLQKSQEAFEQWAIRECFRDHDRGAIVESDFVQHAWPKLHAPDNQQSQTRSAWRYAYYRQNERRCENCRSARPNLAKILDQRDSGQTSLSRPSFLRDADAIATGS